MNYTSSDRMMNEFQISLIEILLCMATELEEGELPIDMDDVNKEANFVSIS